MRGKSRRSIEAEKLVDLDDTPELTAFRAPVRKWLKEHTSEAPPAEAREPDAWVAARREWQKRLATEGLLAVTWPTRYGGRGLGPVEQVVVNQELRRAGVPGAFDMIGIGQLGPALMAHGTEAQKLRHLPPMLTADEVWCQLFSEPAAGSDLAAVQTRARLQEDGSWRLSGQKVWTTGAQYASFGLLLARTDPRRPKHEGLTMFIVPMDADGVSVRPLRQISGEAHFNEVFLDDVALEPDAAVGAVGDGWRVAMTTLMFERTQSWGSGEAFGTGLAQFADTLLEHPASTRDPEVRRRLGEIAAEYIAMRYTGYRVLTSLGQGEVPGVESALGKVTSINAAIAAGELMCDVLGPAGLDAGAYGELVSDLPGWRTAGGTEEILRNLVGERVLGLPREPRPDKGVPFADLQGGRA